MFKVKLNSNKNIQIYFANSYWQYTSLNITIPLNEKNPYLYALNQLVKGDNLPQDCLNEFPIGTKINSLRIENGIAYVDVNKQMVTKLKELKWSTDIDMSILSYNIFNFDSSITDIVFSFDQENINDFNGVKKSEFFAKTKELSTDEINEKLDHLREKFNNMTPDQITSFVKSQSPTSPISPASATSYLATVCVDPGHGGTEPGAVGTYNGTQYNEKSINLAIGLALRNDLLSRNINVIMTRTTDATVGINARYAIANNNNVDLFVSTHCNSSSDSSVYGSSVLYPNNHDTLFSQTVANLVHDRIYSSTFLNKWTDPYSVGSSIGVLYNTNMPAILTETGFMSNTSDLGNLIISSNQTAIGQAISYGIWYWFFV